MRNCVTALLVVAALMLTATNASASVSRWVVIFHIVDANDDGAISAGELDGFCRLVGGMLFSWADRNSDGLVSRQEARLIPIIGRGWFNFAFDAIDTDDDGAISRPELRQAYVRYGRRLFNLVDLNDDGVLTPREFRIVCRFLLNL